MNFNPCILVHCGFIRFRLDIVNIDVIYPIVEVSHVQSQAIIINKFHVVHLLVDELVPSTEHTTGHLGRTSLFGTRIIR